MANRAGRSRRGLDEVLHFWIDEDEQREARTQPSSPAAAPAPATPTAAAVAPAPPWCLAVQPGRPLATWLALELASALSAPGSRARVLAGFAAHPLVDAGARVRWQPLPAGERESLAERVNAALAVEGGAALVALAPGDVRALVTGLPAGRIAGLILPVDATSRGLSQALALLRALPRPPRLRIAVLCLGSGPGDGEVVLRRLEGAARRQLGIAIESLGELRRAGADDRALLRGVSVLEQDPESPSARALARLGQRLGGPGRASHA